jgi:uncharacterized membrane protein YobD (UPF0266 family)
MKITLNKNSFQPFFFFIRKSKIIQRRLTLFYAKIFLLFCCLAGFADVDSGILEITLELFYMMIMSFSLNLFMKNFVGNWKSFKNFYFKKTI